MKNRCKIVQYLLPLLIIVSAALTAQDVNVYWGKENPLGLKMMPQLLAKRGDNVLAYKYGLKSGLTMLKYSSKDLLLKNESQLMGKSSDGNLINSKEYGFESFLILKNKNYIGVSTYNKKTDLNSCFLQPISDDGKLTGKLKKVSEISATSKRNRGAFDIYPSEDSTKILIVNNPPFQKYANEKFGFKILDESLTELNNLEIELPYKDKYFSVSDYILSTDGNIYMLIQIQLEKKEKEKGEAGYYYEIIAVSTSGKGSVKEYKVALPQKYITDVSYKDDGKYLICAGFYNNIEQKGWSRDEINGVFYIRINKETQEVEAKGIKDLDKDFIAELTSQKKANKGRGIASTFLLKQFVKKSDGGSILVAENSYWYTVTTCTTDPKTGARSCRTDYHYVRNNIIAININPDASIKWYTNIPKYQHTVNDGGMYSSYMFATNKDKMFFIFNDNPKNMDPTKVKKASDVKGTGNMKKSVAVIVTLSEDGKFDKKVLFSNKENKSILLPSSYQKVGKNEFIVPAINPGFYCCVIPFKARKYRLARMTFD